jgi:hypothetical protein
VIDSLAYIGFTSPDAQAWMTIGSEILGLPLAASFPDGAVRLRNDDAAWRIAPSTPSADRDSQKANQLGPACRGRLVGCV